METSTNFLPKETTIEEKLYLQYKTSEHYQTSIPRPLFYDNGKREIVLRNTTGTFTMTTPNTDFLDKISEGKVSNFWGYEASSINSLNSDFAIKDRDGNVVDYNESSFIPFITYRIKELSDRHHLIFVSKKIYNSNEKGSFACTFTSLKDALDFRAGKSLSECWCIFIEPGVYEESGGLNLYPNTLIRGCGKYGTTIKMTNTSSYLFQLPSGPSTFEKIKVENLAITQDTLSNGYYNCAFLLQFDSNTTPLSLSLEKVYIENLATGLATSNSGTYSSAKITLTNCTFKVGLFGINVSATAITAFIIHLYNLNSTKVGAGVNLNNSLLYGSNLMIFGNFTNGIASTLNTVIKYHGIHINDVGTGLYVLDTPIIDIFTIFIESTVNRHLYIEGGDVELSNASFLLPKIEINSSAFFSYKGKYKTKGELEQLAITILGRFNLFEYDYVYKNIKNFFIDPILNTSYFETLSNVSQSGNSLKLTDTSLQTIFDNIEGTFYWVEFYYVDNGTVVQSNLNPFEGTYSIRCEFISGTGNWGYGIRRNVSNENWSGYDHMTFRVNSNSTNRIYIYLGDSSGAGKWVLYQIQNTKTWEEVNVSFDSWTRTSVSDIRLYFTLESSATVMYIDYFVLHGTPSYSSSGYALTKVIPINSSSDLYYSELLLGINKDDDDLDVEIKMDISLDGGNNWKTNINPDKFTLWHSTESGGILETPDSGTWLNKKNLKIKFNFTTSNSTKTPTLYDWSFMWIYQWT